MSYPCDGLICVAVGQVTLPSGRLTAPRSDVRVCGEPVNGISKRFGSRRLRESQRLHEPGWVDPQREAGVPQRGEDAGHLLTPRSILKIRAASCVGGKRPTKPP